MAAHHPWTFAFGILGNIISIMMYLSPLPTFYRVYRKKSTEGFQSIPYLVALSSAMLWIYYATLISNDFLLITINSIGCVVESIYIVVFIIYAPRKARMRTLQIILLMNFAGFLSVFLPTLFFAGGLNRRHIVGWFCVVLSTAVFAAPLTIMREVIRTKSVEFMPFILSLSITLNSIMWFLYGILLKDFYIVLPNVMGVILGTIQMILYAIYKEGQQAVHNKQREVAQQIQTTTAIANTNPQLLKNNTCEEHRVSLSPGPIIAAVDGARENTDSGKQRQPGKESIEAPAQTHSSV